MKYSLASLLAFVAIIGAAFQQTSRPPSTTPSSAEQRWVDSVFALMSDDERLGQLLWIRAHSNWDESRNAEVERLIREYHLGGLTFFQGNPAEQIRLVNRYQAAARIPLFIAMDAEWGLGMRFKTHAMSFPRQLMLGAIQDNTLLYELGAEVARQCRRVGVHINFAPVADINNNPDNPVINTRSFGEDRVNVAGKAYMYMKGMQDHGLMACAKHFPGHGDTDVDSHKDLPVIRHDRARLDSIELFPFRILLEQGVGSVMVAHLHVPALDSTPNLPTTLSQKAVRGILHEQLGYQGLIMTDALGMKGVTKHYRPGEVEAMALLAGNDVLLLPQDVPAAFRTIKQYIREGKLSWARIYASTRKVLHAKYRMGLTRFDPIPTEGLERDLFPPAAQALKRKLIREALTLVRNDAGMLPFDSLEHMKLATLALGAKDTTLWQRRLLEWNPHTQIEWHELELSNRAIKLLIGKLRKYDAVVIGLHGLKTTPSDDGNYGLPASAVRFLEAARIDGIPLVLVNFGNPYLLRHFDRFPTVVQAYEDNEDVHDLAAQAMAGVFGFRGRLPVTASPAARYGQGVRTRPSYRLGWALPEEVGLLSDSLALLDTLMLMAIDSGATPGGVVLVARKGRIVWHKAYGHHTHARKRPTRTDDLFDLASVTKVMASTLSLMKLYEEGLLDIDAPLSQYLPQARNTNKADIIIRDMLYHRARLQPWIPFYLETLDEKGQPLDSLYQARPDARYSVRVAERLFLRHDWVDTIWARIYTSELLDTVAYRYSDLAFYFANALIQQLSGMPVDEFAERHFYKPLGLHRISFNPRERFGKEAIVPTENDDYFRHQVLQGYVHDMGAAMLGGVSGHAGLFGSAKDLAVLAQMLLQQGHYGGRQVLSPQTVATFTHRCPACTRRGLGFDMKQLDPDQNPNMAPSASAFTFGHLGFTGTAVWIDPAWEIVFVFLSNRVWPTMENRKLIDMDIRLRAHEAVYRALKVE